MQIYSYIYIQLPSWPSSPRLYICIYVYIYNYIYVQNTNLFIYIYTLTKLAFFATAPSKDFFNRRRPVGLRAWSHRVILHTTAYLPKDTHTDTHTCTHASYREQTRVQTHPAPPSSATKCSVLQCVAVCCSVLHPKPPSSATKAMQWS